MIAAQQPGTGTTLMPDSLQRSTTWKPGSQISGVPASEMRFFYHEGFLYLYETVLGTDDTSAKKAIFRNQHIYKKEYYKSGIKDIYNKKTFTELDNLGVLPEDTSDIFFVLQKKRLYSFFFDSYENDASSYQLLFTVMKTYNLDTGVLSSILRIFDENIHDLQRIDDNNYRMLFKGESLTLTDTQLFYRLSSGTTKGLLLYIHMAVSLQQGFDLLIDEVENHFHKTLVENMISLYKDKTVNKHNATLIFTTHYCEVMDQMGRQDNIWICKTGKTIFLSNMYEDYKIRPELLKSKQYYNNAFQTAVNYDELMNLKRLLKK
ncbi:MAG: AAA family ATPase [Lachnospiraceae bacterium]|nr:AAA family ATPase [Lachnospiraceae bacterium]